MIAVQYNGGNFSLVRSHHQLDAAIGMNSVWAGSQKVQISWFPGSTFNRRSSMRSPMGSPVCVQKRW